MIRKLLIILFCLMVKDIEAKDYRFIVWLHNGETNTFLFSAKPKVTYENQMFVIKTTQTMVQYEVAAVHMFTIKEDESTDVQDIKNKTGKVFYGDGKVEMKGGKPNSLVYIYLADGQIVEKKKTNGDGTVDFSICQYPKGVYIIKSKTITYKIYKQ